MPSVALFAWPIVTLLLFAKLGPVRGLIWSVMLGYLLLPQRFDIDVPGMPPLNKTSVVPLSALLATLIFDRRNHRSQSQRPAVHKDPLFQTMFWGLIVLWVLSPLGTVLTNSEPLISGPNTRPGLRLSEIRSLYLEAIFLIIPYFLAMRLLHDPKSHEVLLRALVLSGLAYVIPILIETRLSPQFHTWVYGYFPHTWGQHIRGGAYRPVVFLEHGLSVGFFLCSLGLAAFALAYRAVGLSRLLLIGAGVLFCAVLVLSKNTGALMLVLVFAPLVFFTSRRMQMRVVVAISILFLSYPALRQAELLPMDDIVLTVEEKLSAERAGSLATRVVNEELLLEHSSSKPVFGWGTWSRWRVFDERGRDITIADGLWVIVLSERGWVGYIVTFGLITLPVFFLARARRRRDVPTTTVILAVTTACNLIYILPNSTLTPIAFLMIGAMAGFVRNLAPEDDPSLSEGPDPAPGSGGAPPGRSGRPGYTRFPNGDPGRVATPAVAPVAATERTPASQTRSEPRYGRKQRSQGARPSSIRGSQ